ncbi:hypothetical protein V6Z11_A05G360100 [Gossypium hirsutum]
MKIFSWNVCHGVGNPATVQEFKQLLVANVPDMVFLCETKIQSNSLKRIRTVCRMDGCLAVSSEGKSGGLALLWREGVNVEVQSYSKFHIESVEGGRRRPKIQLDEFSDFLEELNLTDVKTCNGWFTWTNNRDGTRLVKERLDRFAISEVAMEKMPFLLANIVRQSKPDHESDGGCNAMEKMESIWDKLGPWQYKRYKGMKHNIKSLEKEINEIMDGPTNEGVRASRQGPWINHLFFANDALLFVRNNQKEVEAFTEILESFERMSCQRVNLDKSMVYFSPNTPDSQQAILSGLLKLKVVANLDGYIGLPIPIGKKKSAAFQGIIDRVAKRINSWSKWLLSNGSKEIFVKSILQSIPTYAFSVFFAPEGVFEEIQALIRRVWWGEREITEVGI